MTLQLFVHRHLTGRDGIVKDQIGRDADDKVVLFLDFDGVLHPYPGRNEQLFCRLDLLQEWLRRRPHVEIVISSDWRDVHSANALAAHFDEDLRSRILGVTPRVTRDSWEQFDGEPRTTAHTRHVEILRWLAQHGRSRPWLALDDQAGLYPPGTWQLVLCDPSVGLTRAILEHLDRVLVLVQDSGDPFLTARTRLLAHLLELLRAGGEDGRSGDPGIEAWLDEWLLEPHPELGGHRPGAVILAKDGVERAIELLDRLFGGAPG